MVKKLILISSMLIYSNIVFASAYTKFLYQNYNNIFNYSDVCIAHPTPNGIKCIKYIKQKSYKTIRT